MSNQRGRLRRSVFAAVITAAMVMSVSIWQEKPTSGASVPKLETIRVALFIEAPGKYRLNTAAGTFAAAGGLSIGMRTPAAVEPWFDAGAAPVRIAADDYKSKVAETADYNTASSIQKRLQALGGSAVITSQAKNGKTVYIVAEGSYSSSEDAKAAGDKWGKDASIITLVGTAKPSVMGPLHLEGGSYPNEAAARTAARAFGAAGMDAFAAVRNTGAGLAYSIMVGSAADAAGLATVKAQAAKVAGSPALREADNKTPYLLIRDDHTVSGSAKSANLSYSFPTGSAKVWLSTAGSQGITFTERSNSKYRGSFELSVYNGKLAIVNELPFEQYLYSVVPSEMPSSWPAEALKSQAVAARTYALYQGFGYGIAHVNDTELSQVYTGIGGEAASTTAAINATAGKIAMHNGKPIEALFSSNAGGQTADATEIWGNAVSYLKSVPSPDQNAEKGLKTWYRVAIPQGGTGYIREDLMADTGQRNPVGAKIYKTTADGVNVRQTPVINDKLASVGKLAKGTEVVLIDQSIESNKMSWILGPYTAEEIQKSSGWSSPVRTLDAKYGVSGRIIGMSINGSPLNTKTPITYRTLMGGLPSTRFSIDETARVKIVGGSGAESERPSGGDKLYIMGADGKSTALSASDYYIASGDGTLRAATRDPKFRFVGYGNGHGVGLSQYGALGLAQLGYDYAYILQYYYKDITIEG